MPVWFWKLRQRKAFEVQTGLDDVSLSSGWLCRWLLLGGLGFLLPLPVVAPRPGRGLRDAKLLDHGRVTEQTAATRIQLFVSVPKVVREVCRTYTGNGCHRSYFGGPVFGEIRTESVCSLQKGGADTSLRKRSTVLGEVPMVERAAHRSLGPGDHL